MSNLAEDNDPYASLAVIEPDPEVKRKGNPTFKPGVSGNPRGRPKTKHLDAKKSNRTIRSEEYLNLVRKFKPHLTKAVQAAVKILDNDEAHDGNKLKASALIISTYKDLVKELYNYQYDEEEGEEIQEKSAPIFSLTMVTGNKEE